MLFEIFVSVVLVLFLFVFLRQFLRRPVQTMESRLMDERERILVQYDKDLRSASTPEERSRLFMRKESDLERLNRP